MESLIAFLLDNIFIVIVAAGFLMSLLGKGKQQRRAGRMPDFGGGPMLGGPAPEGSRSVPEPSQAPSVQTSQPIYTSAMSQPASEGRAMTARSSHAGNFPRSTHNALRTPQAGQAARNQASAGASTVKRIDADDLRQAVLWAEILGPPRARKPHGRINR
jgi:hypothetical protein